MAGNSFGQLFRISTFGESHGTAVGGIIDGCPPNLEISEADLQAELDRRKPGQSDLTTPRNESDRISILSGVFNGQTTGTPIAFLAYNKDAKSGDYNELSQLYRPGHADFTYEKKYGIRDWRGSGRASARETLARVAAGAVAQKYLKEKFQMQFLSFVEQVGEIRAECDYNSISRANIDKSLVRCPDQIKSKEMQEVIEHVKSEGDSIGGIIRGIIKNVPIGLGEPVFDKLPALLGHAMLSINAVKGFDIGEGFESVKLKGSEHNDELALNKNGMPAFKTNRAGGTLGGISNGSDIHFRVAFKPVSTIAKKQISLTVDNKQTEFSAVGRHDPCVLPRAVPIVDAMAALVIMDLALQARI